ncbi:MAG: hypothetical protein ACREJ0_28860 [Geminicoccaceae bacterium]
MATPVTDLRARLRNAGVTEGQADAISGAFEALSNQIAELGAQVRNVVVGQRIQMGLLLLVAAAILAPYVAAWASMTS